MHRHFHYLDKRNRQKSHLEKGVVPQQTLMVEKNLNKSSSFLCHTPFYSVICICSLAFPSLSSYSFSTSYVTLHCANAPASAQLADGGGRQVWIKWMWQNGVRGAYMVMKTSCCTVGVKGNLMQKQNRLKTVKQTQKSIKKKLWT